MPEVILNGPAGRLEGRYFPSKFKNAPVALVLHPHPQHGGTMDNKVVYNLYQNFARHHFSVLRFNFRGVGRSQGTYDEGIGELSDAAAALDWLQLQNPDAITFWISGFSFGAWIAMQLLMRRPELDGFISVSPPANLYDFSFLAPCPSSGIIVQGDQDSITEEEAVRKLADKLSAQRNINVEYDVIKGGDHFFRTTMDAFNESVSTYLKKRIGTMDEERRIKMDKKRRQAMLAELQSSQEE